MLEVTVDVDSGSGAVDSTGGVTAASSGFLHTMGERGCRITSARSIGWWMDRVRYMENGEHVGCLYTSRAVAYRSDPVTLGWIYDVAVFEGSGCSVLELLLKHSGRTQSTPGPMRRKDQSKKKHGAVSRVLYYNSGQVLDPSIHVGALFCRASIHGTIQGVP